VDDEYPYFLNSGEWGLEVHSDAADIIIPMSYGVFTIPGGTTCESAEPYVRRDTVRGNFYGREDTYLLSGKSATYKNVQEALIDAF